MTAHTLPSKLMVDVAAGPVGKQPRNGKELLRP